MATEKNQKLVSKTFIGVGLATIATGVVRGFCHATNIHLDNYLEKSLIALPILSQSVMGYLDGIGLMRNGKQITGNYPNIMESELIKIIGPKDNEIMTREQYGASMCFMGEGTAALTEIFIGYGLGYLAGKAVKHFS